MRRTLTLFLATGFGVGYLPVAPGTFGAAVGVGYWWLLREWLPVAVFYWAAVAAGIAVAVWCAGAAARLLGQPDPACVVIDELTVLPFCLIGLGNGWWEVAAAFLLFRVCDVWKPGPIGTIQRWPGGWGIVADDILAALSACAGVHLLRALVNLMAS